MEFYLYSIVLPIIIIAIVFWFHRPLKINNISKALIRGFIPLSVYILLVYFLEMENYIDSSWAFYSLIIFFIVYIIISIVLKIVLKQKKLQIIYATDNTKYSYQYEDGLNSSMDLFYIYHSKTKTLVKYNSVKSNVFSKKKIILVTFILENINNNEKNNHLIFNTISIFLL